MQIKRSSGSVVGVDLPAGVLPRDGAHAIALRQIGQGAYLHVNGYLESSKIVRATAVSVLHPILTLHGVLTWRGRIASVRTSAGDSYTATFGKSSSVLANHLDVPLRPVDIPGGTAVHVVGVVALSGSLAVQTMTAQLHSTTVRAKVGTSAAGHVVPASRRWNGAGAFEFRDHHFPGQSPTAGR